MTFQVGADESELGVALGYLPGVRGHAALSVGPDGDGGDALAVWRLGPTGSAGGAWVFRLDAVERESGQLHRVMDLLRGRCVVDWVTDTPADALGRVAHLLPAELVAALTASIAVIPDLLKEIGEYRQRYADAVDEYRFTTKSKVLPLAWSLEVPSDPTMARQILTSSQWAAASPVAASALELVGALERAVGLWHDTEQARYRRPYLRSFGEPQALPPQWLARLHAVASIRPTGQA